jgi:methyl-accepting chemotaxis protein
MFTTINRKLYVGFGSIIAIIVILFFEGLVVTARQNAARSQAAIALAIVQDLEHVQAQTLDIRLGLVEYLLTGDPRQQAKVSIEIAGLPRLFDDAKAKAPPDFLRDLLARMEVNERNWVDKFARPLIAERQRVDTGNATAGDLQVFYAKQDPTSWSDESAALSDQMHTAVETTERASAAAVAQAVSVGATIDAVGTIAAIVLCLVIAYRTAASIIKPLRRTIDVLRNIAEGEGDLTRRVNETTGDELGEMGRWFNLFMAKLELLVTDVARSTHGVTGACENLFSVSHQMRVGAEETSAQANLVAAASEQVTRNLQTVAAATEEMNASIGEISKNASAAAGVAARAVERAQSANVTMSRLGESSAEIGEVVKLISSVAQQTKMLALNATIEAARAGEAGKGFAVVANEVKELANETAKAAKQISQKIQAITTGTTGAVAVIADIGTIIAQMHDISTTIASAVEEQTATTNEIARNVSEAAIGESNVTENITSVAEAAKHASIGAFATQNAAGELAGMASELRRIVGVFKVAGGHIAVVTPAAARAA